MGPGELPPGAIIQMQVIGVTAVPLAGPADFGGWGQEPRGTPKPCGGGQRGLEVAGKQGQGGAAPGSRRWEGAAAFSLEAGPPDCVDGDEKCVRAVGGSVGPPWRGSRACGGLLGGPQGRTRSVRRKGLETDSVAEEHGHVRPRGSLRHVRHTRVLS